MTYSHLDSASSQPVCGSTIAKLSGVVTRMCGGLRRCFWRSAGCRVTGPQSDPDRVFQGPGLSARLAQDSFQYHKPVLGAARHRRSESPGCATRRPRDPADQPVDDPQKSGERFFPDPVGDDNRTDSRFAIFGMQSSWASVGSSKRFAKPAGGIRVETGKELLQIPEALMRFR